MHGHPGMATHKKRITAVVIPQQNHNFSFLIAGYNSQLLHIIILKTADCCSYKQNNFPFLVAGCNSTSTPLHHIALVLRHKDITVLAYDFDVTLIRM